MIEYLIKRTDGEWFEFPSGSDPYRPVTIPFKKVEGWGDGRIEIDGCQISFSYEDPGIQVSFQGEIPQELADRIVAEISQTIESESGQKSEAIQIA